MILDNEYENYIMPTFSMIKWFGVTFPAIYLTVMYDFDNRNHILEQLWAEYYVEHPNNYV